MLSPKSIPEQHAIQEKSEERSRICNEKINMKCPFVTVNTMNADLVHLIPPNDHVCNNILFRTNLVNYVAGKQGEHLEHRHLIRGPNTQI